MRLSPGAVGALGVVAVLALVLGYWHILAARPDVAEIVPREAAVRAPSPAAPAPTAA